MKIIYFLSSALLVCILYSCKKELKVSKTETDTFLHVYNSDQNNGCLFISPAADNGFVLITTSPNPGIDAGLVINFIKVNSEGSLEWTKTLPDTFYRIQLTDLKDGTILVNSYDYYGKFLRIDLNGNIIFRSNYNTVKLNIGYSSAIRGANGNFFVSETNGWSTLNASTNRIRNFKNDGTYINNRIIADASFGGKISDYYLYAFQSPETYYIFGTMYPHPISNLNNPKVFVSKLEFAGNSVISKKITILDPLNNWSLNYYNANYLFTDDKQLIIAITQIIKARLTSHIFKVDENLNLLWDFSFLIPGYNIASISSITKCTDGNYLFCGRCETDTKYNDQPFAAKVSSDGHIIWTKIFPMPSEGTLASGKQLYDGSLIFGGTTGSFGNGNNQNDVFMIKTDNDGNLK